MNGRSTEDALNYLSKRGVTHSEQMVLRWIREGKIKANIVSKQIGYEVDYESLVAFADAYLKVRKPKYSEPVNDQLYQSERLKQSVKQLDQATNKETIKWFMDRTHEQTQEFKAFKRLVRSLVDEETWKMICDRWNQELTNKRNARKEK